MREVDVGTVRDTVARLAKESNFISEPDVTKALRDALEKEESPTAKEIIKEILENNEIAAREEMPLCQDTGLAVVFLEVGQDVHFTGGDLNEAVDEGVRQAYGEAYLRKSAVEHPMRRVNTKDNTPAIIHIDIVPGDKVTVRFAPKGGGSENMSTVTMLTPAHGYDGVKKFVIEWIRKAGANPCPPVVVGVGLGGTFEQTAFIAKKALLRKIGSKAEDELNAKLEEELLEEINKLGIGPQGFGGRTTALAVFVESFPCHIASLPVAVNGGKHGSRETDNPTQNRGCGKAQNRRQGADFRRNLHRARRGA
jgi:fumarate hydratase subunit alpha